jgi:hypothetical protein
MERPNLADTAGRPAVCPACGSINLAVANKTADESTYWRCCACGEVWNASRRQKTIPTRYDPPRRRY